jgi:hypothetical protein
VHGCTCAHVLCVCVCVCRVLSSGLHQKRCQGESRVGTMCCRVSPPELWYGVQKTNAMGLPECTRLVLFYHCHVMTVSSLSIVVTWVIGIVVMRPFASVLLSLPLSLCLHWSRTTAVLRGGECSRYSSDDQLQLRQSA